MRSEWSKHELSGERFGKLLVIDFGDTRCGYVQWLCLCDCGNFTSKTSHSLVTSIFLSCGCKKSSEEKSAIPDRQRTQTERLKKCLAGIKQRCNNPRNKAYHYYGGRGIKLCEPWHNLDTFIEALGPHPGNGFSLDRINNDGNYEPGNVRWATAKQQANNQRPRRKKSRSDKK